MTEFGLFGVECVEIVPGMSWLPGFADSGVLAPLIADICRVSPPRHMQTSRGFSMSVATTSCGQVGWISDRRGYRYSETDPETGQIWPAMPDAFLRLAIEAADLGGFSNYTPDTCLLNRYVPGTQMGAHQDRNERDFSAPIVSVSLGIPARFFVQGTKRGGASLPVDLSDGDVLVFGGPARRRFHGVRKLKPASHPLFQSIRWNLTFRQAL